MATHTVRYAVDALYTFEDDKRKVEVFRFMSGTIGMRLVNKADPGPVTRLKISPKGAQHLALGLAYVEQRQHGPIRAQQFIEDVEELPELEWQYHAAERIEMIPERLEAWYDSLNPTEQRLVNQWESDGMTRQEALEKLQQDLNDAAEEDGMG